MKTKLSLKQAYEEYMRMRKLGKLDRDIAKSMGLRKEDLYKIINYFKEKENGR